jgi:hypothetical protein
MGLTESINLFLTLPFAAPLFFQPHLSWFSLGYDL